MRDGASGHSNLDFTPSAVTERHNRIAIVCTGPSIEEHGFDCRFPDGVAVVAVNGAIKFCAAHYWFTLDQSPKNQQLMRHRKKGCKYYTARGLSHCGPLIPGIFNLERVGGQLGDTHVVEYGLATDPTKIHTGNSGWGALQLAAHMRPRKVALFGIDGGGGYSHSQGGPTDLAMVPALFDSAILQLHQRGIEVVNGSPQSAVTAFPRMTPQQAKDWLCKQ